MRLINSIHLMIFYQEFMDNICLLQFTKHVLIYFQIKNFPYPYNNYGNKKSSKIFDETNNVHLMIFQPKKKKNGIFDETNNVHLMIFLRNLWITFVNNTWKPYSKQ